VKRGDNEFHGVLAVPERAHGRSLTFRSQPMPLSMYSVSIPVLIRGQENLLRHNGMEIGTADYLGRT
jgi:hypothetical protein